MASNSNRARPFHTTYDARGFQVSADYSGSEPDPGYSYDGDGNLVKESENGSVKSYYVRSTLLNATISELTPTGDLKEGAVLSNLGAKIAVLKDNEFRFFHVDPSGSYEKHVKVDKSTASKTQYDPTGRENNYQGPTGAGPCSVDCPPPFNPPGGFDGLAILLARKRQQRWQRDAFSLIPIFNALGIIGLTPSAPPDGWDPNEGLTPPSQFHPARFGGFESTWVRFRGYTEDTSIVPYRTISLFSFVPAQEEVPSVPLVNQETFTITKNGLRDLVKEFFEVYGKRFRHCIWSIFDKDRFDRKTDADQLIKPGTDRFPYDKTKIVNYSEYGKAHFEGSTGTINLPRNYNSQKLVDGTTVSAKEDFFRSLAHEYGNYLSWYVTRNEYGGGDAARYGTLEGIKGMTDLGDGLQSVQKDFDTGARIEKCIWKNTSF